jgi:AcrR family transcriptional regulator
MPIVSRNTERTHDIVKAAAQLFALQGYHRTSTREIARLADVSENTLFRHFDHKEDLFWSAIRSHSAGLKLRRDLLDGMTKCDAPEVVLPKLVDLLIDTVTFSPELLRLIAVAFLELHSKAEVFSKEYLSPVFSTINRYLEQNIEDGKVRNLDPSIMTVSLVMTVLLHTALSKLIDGEKMPYADSRQAARAYTKFWLDVLVPEMLAHSRSITPGEGKTLA